VPEATRWYLFHFLKSPTGQQQLLGGGAGVGRPNLNAPSIEAIPIPLPPLNEQAVIVDRIESMLQSLEKLGSQLERDSNTFSALRQAVLRTAFSGALVAQDPSDEPASVLLARIAAKHDQAKIVPKRGHQKKIGA
jgi:type I restriction enzyme S subunit